MARRLAIVLCGAAALALPGCGGDGGGGSSGEEGITVDNVRVLAIVEVRETDFALEPKTMRIERFGYYGLKATNDGDVPHALALEGPGLEQRTKEIAPGESETMLVFFRKAGNYKLYCPIGDHEQQGMKATVRVH